MLEESEIWTSDEDRSQGEPFIRLCEWMRQRGWTTPLPLPCVITAALWERLERIPFRIVQSTRLEDRVRHLAGRARACLDAHPDAAACDPASEETLVFSASLPCRAEDPSRQILHLRIGPLEGIGPAIMLGLPEDLPLPRAPRRGTAPPAVDATPTPIHTLNRSRGELLPA